MFCRSLVLVGASMVLASAADVRVVEEIAAKVNGDIITRGELDQKRRDIELALRQQGLTGAKLADAAREYAANALRDQIDQLLLVQKAKDSNVNVDGEVTRRLAEIQVQSKITDPDKFHDYVREQAGMPFEEYKQQLTNELLTRRVIGQEVGSHITIPEPDARKYYEEHQKDFVREEQVFLSQILISTEGKTPDQAAAAEKKAKDVAARARKGEKFSDLVRQSSDDPETARNGGYLGAYKRGLLRKEIEDVVFKEKKGFVTDPIKLAQPAGFLILKVEEHFEAGQASFDEVKNEIQDKLAEPKMEPRVREFLTKLRLAAFLEIKDGYVDSGAAPGKDTRWHDVVQLKPQTTTKEEVAARNRPHKKVLFVPIPGTHKKMKPAAPDVPPPVPTPGPAEPSQPAQGQAQEPAAAPVKQ